MKDINKFKKMELSFSMWSANHYTARTNAGVAFISYNTIVAFKAKDSGKVTLGCEYGCSRVTMKNVCKWLGVDSITDVRKGIADGTYLYDEELK